MEELKIAAEMAHECMTKTIVAVAGMHIDGSARNALAVTLLRASLDHGRAMAVLIATHAEEYGASAIALQRAQVETLFRGAFFAREATNKEVQYFIDNDRMPERTGPDGKSRQLNPKALAPLIGDVLSAGNNQTLTNFIDDGWGVLCGLVHGGMATVANYHNAEIGFHLEAKIAAEICGQAMALTQLAMLAIAAISTNSDEQKSDLFQDPYAAAEVFHEYKKNHF